MEKHLDTDEIAQQIAQRMRAIRMENSRETAIAVLSEAYAILHDLGETELSTALLAASKRLGDKLKERPLTIPLTPPNGKSSDTLLV
jgi:hypothetical protein